MKEGSMKTLRFSLLVLFVYGMHAVTQSYPDQTAKPSGPNSTTVQGCLERSGHDYKLTDKSGTAYHLAGNTAILRDHVGHEVEITGMTAVSGEAPGAPTATGKEGAPAEIDVSRVKHISSTCKSDKDTEKQPMSEKPPLSEKPPVPPPR
jgi:hypothetical protein